MPRHVQWNKQWTGECELVIQQWTSIRHSRRYHSHSRFFLCFSFTLQLDFLIDRASSNTEVLFSKMHSFRCVFPWTSGAGAWSSRRSSRRPFSTIALKCGFNRCRRFHQTAETVRKVLGATRGTWKVWWFVIAFFFANLNCLPRLKSIHQNHFYFQGGTAKRRISRADDSNHTGTRSEWRVVKGTSCTFFNVCN